MRLYYVPGACSLASHIALNEIGAAFELDQVDTKAGLTQSGADFARLNPNGYVPALELDDGQVLTEGAAILQYIAALAPSAELAPTDPLSRARLQQHLNYVASELHKAFSPFFSGRDLSSAEREAATAGVARRLDYVDGLFADGREHLLGEAFTVADAYLFVVSSWATPTGIGLDRWPNLKAFVERVGQRPHVQAAMRREGLLN